MKRKKWLNKPLMQKNDYGSTKSGSGRGWYEMKKFADEYMDYSIEKTKEQNPGLGPEEIMDKISGLVKNHIAADDLVRIKDSDEVGIVASLSNGKYVIDCGDHFRKAEFSNLLKLTVADIDDSVFYRKPYKKAESIWVDTTPVRECLNLVLADIPFADKVASLPETNSSVCVFTDGVIGREAFVKTASKKGKIVGEWGGTGYKVEFADGTNSVRWLQELFIY